MSLYLIGPVFLRLTGAAPGCLYKVIIPANSLKVFSTLASVIL
jgi:hypothetical protein